MRSVEYVEYASLFECKIKLNVFQHKKNAILIGELRLKHQLRIAMVLRVHQQRSMHCRFINMFTLWCEQAKKKKIELLDILEIKKPV